LKKRIPSNRQRKSRRSLMVLRKKEMGVVHMKKKRRGRRGRVKSEEQYLLGKRSGRGVDEVARKSGVWFLFGKEVDVLSR